MAMKIVGPNENLDVLSGAEREAVINARKSALQSPKKVHLQF